MKQRDMFAIAVISIIVAIAGYFLTNIFIATPENRTGEVEIVTPIETSFDDEGQTALRRPDSLDFFRDPNVNAGGSNNTLTPN